MRLAGNAILVYSVALILGQLGCGAAGGEAIAGATTVPQAMRISPNTVTAGQSSFVLTVSGANFSHYCVILWNGAARTTTFVSPQQVNAQIPSPDVAQASIVSVVVENMRSGHMSNTLPLTVADPLRVTTNQLPAGKAGVSYSAPLSVSGGVSPYRWSLASGSLPDGLAMDLRTGTVSGTAGSAGNFTFTVWVTDSAASSAKANLAIDIASAAQGPSTTSLAAAQFYGSGLGSDGLANTTVGPTGNTVSYRFRATHSGVLQQVRVYLIPDHAGYAGGTGGTIQVTLNADDSTPSHNPAPTVHASYLMSNVLSLASPARYFYVLKFASPPALAAGQLYHVVFKNVDPSPTVNYLSVDALYQEVPTSPVQPTVSDTDAAVLLGDASGAWKPRPGYTPIYELDLQDGSSEGIGYIEGWVGAPQSISGTNAVRETFTVSGSQVKVTSAAIRLARVNGNDPLVIRLEDADGSLIEQGSVPASVVTLSSSTSPSYVWVKYPFAATCTLLPGHTYHLVFEATSTSSYQVFPIRKGAAYGFQDTTFFHDGNAEFKQNDSWVGWTQWGVTNRLDSDLQFYFTVVP
jgi:hypothetical protein